MSMGKGRRVLAAPVAVVMALLLWAGSARGQCSGGGRPPSNASMGPGRSPGILLSQQQVIGPLQQVALLTALQQQQLQQIALQQQQLQQIALQQRILTARIAARQKKAQQQQQQLQQQELWNTLQRDAQLQQQTTDLLARQQKQATPPPAAGPAGDSTFPGKDRVGKGVARGAGG
jgi:hypothetical protein